MGPHHTLWDAGAHLDFETWETDHARFFFRDASERWSRFFRRGGIVAGAHIAVESVAGIVPIHLLTSGCAA